MNCRFWIAVREFDRIYKIDKMDFQEILFILLILSVHHGLMGWVAVVFGSVLIVRVAVVF